MNLRSLHSSVRTHSPTLKVAMRLLKAHRHSRTPPQNQVSVYLSTLAVAIIPFTARKLM